MWTPWKAAREERHLLLTTLQGLTTQFSDNLKHQQDSHTESLKVIAEANIRIAESLGIQAKSFGSWIESFKVAAQPESRVMNDAAEILIQNERLEKAGFPAKANQRDQMQFVQDTMNIDELTEQMFG